MAGAWYLALAALAGLPGASFLIQFGSTALFGLASVGEERRFLDYRALVSGLLGGMSLATAILLAPVGLGLLRGEEGYRWAAAAISGVLLSLGIVVAVAGVGQAP